jgi:hypothetical protein
MMWLTWRQFRAQTIVTSAALTVLALVLWRTGPDLAHLYDTSSIATCKPDINCATLATRFLNKLPKINTLMYFLGIGLLFAAPAIIGVFWGAPLVAREIEAHTHRLAWNQSVTRTRWLAIKLAIIALAAMATTGLLSLMLTWWSSPIDRAASLNPTHGISLIRMAPVLFGARGITPVAYAAFAFTLGVTAGEAGHGRHPGRLRRHPARHGQLDPAAPHRTRPRQRGAQPRKRPRAKRLHRARDALLHPARRLDPVQPGHRQGRPPVPSRTHRGLPDPQLPGVPGLDRQTSPPAADHLPARQPLLDLPVV